MIDHRSFLSLLSFFFLFATSIRLYTNYVFSFLKSDVARALLARGNARNMGGEKLLAEAKLKPNKVPQLSTL